MAAAVAARRSACGTFSSPPAGHATAMMTGARIGLARSRSSAAASGSAPRRRTARRSASASTSPNALRPAPLITTKRHGRCLAMVGRGHGRGQHDTQVLLAGGGIGEHRARPARVDSGESVHDYRRA